MLKASYYIRDNYVRKNGESAVYIVTHVHRKKLWLATGVTCRPQDFDKAKGRIKGSGKAVDDKNAFLAAAMQRFRRINLNYHISEKEITIDIIKREFDNPSNTGCFIKYMQDQIEKRKGQLSHATVKQQMSALNKLRLFRSTIMFADLTESLIEDYKMYLKKTHKNSANTIEANIKDLKIYVNRACSESLMNKNIFENYRAKRVKTSYTYLDKKELTLLYNMYIENTFDKSCQIALRHFLFQCFTGLRFSDVKNITHEMISNDKLYFVPVKTKNIKRETVIVPLISPARRLVKDENPVRVFGTVFTTFTEQASNRLLKKIMKIADISKHVTTHVGRHTFATLYYEQTSDVASLQKLLGHSRITETMIYAHVSEAMKEKQMKLFEKSLPL